MTVTTALKQPQYDEYVPGPVDPDVDVEGLRTYTTEELNRLAEFIRQNRQLPSFSGGYRTTPIATGADNVTPIPVPIVEFIANTGEQGMFWDLVNHRLVMNKVRGVVYLGVSLTAEVDTLTTYTLEVFRGGLPTGIRTVVDISNQETWSFMHIEGLALAQEGDQFDVRISSSAGASTFNVETATFTSFRIG